MRECVCAGVACVLGGLHRMCVNNTYWATCSRLFKATTAAVATLRAQCFCAVLCLSANQDDLHKTHSADQTHTNFELLYCMSEYNAKTEKLMFLLCLHRNYVKRPKAS